MQSLVLQNQFNSEENIKANSQKPYLPPPRIKPSPLTTFQTPSLPLPVAFNRPMAPSYPLQPQTPFMPPPPLIDKTQASSSQYAQRIKEYPNGMFYPYSFEWKPSPSMKKQKRFSSPYLMRPIEAEHLDRMPDILVPIRLELEVEGNKLRDVFLWNLNEPHITPKQYAEIYCTDLQLEKSFANHIEQSLHHQLLEYKQFYEAGLLLQEGLVPIHLEIQVGLQCLRDRFYWDISPENPLTPEDFASQLCAEMGLAGEFKVLISHAIREQVQNHLSDYQTQSLHFRDVGQMLRNEEGAEMFYPSLSEMDSEQLMQSMQMNERNARRLRREGRRR